MLLEIISFVNHKGGVGKTTSVLSVAGILAKKLKRKVLAIDLDPQANLTKGLGIIPEEMDFNLSDVLREEVELREIVIETESGFDLAPSSLDLALADTFLVERIGREVILREIIEKISDNYDLVLIDCPPSLGILTINALSASTNVLIPVETSFFALEGFASILDRMKTIKSKINPDLKLLGVLATKYDMRKNIHKESLKEIKESIPGKVFDSVIGTNVKLEESQREGQTIFEYSPKNAKDYIKVTKEILSRIS